MAIANTHLESLEYCQRITGVGSIYERKDTAKHGWKRAWRWSVQSQRDIMDILRQMLPYLVVKRERVIEALSTWKDI